MNKVQFVLVFYILTLFFYLESRIKKNINAFSSYEISREPRDVMRRVLLNTGNMFYNLFSQSTFKTACFGVPLYLLSRPLDHKIHNYFYDYELRKNQHQPEKIISKIGMNVGIGLIIPPIIFDFMSNDSFKIRRGEIFSAGLLTVLGTKNLLKLIPTEANKRPCHEEYSKHLHTRSYGGNPSGHMACLGYATSFWAAEKGLLLGIPMAGLMSLAGAFLVVSNRHYLSQVVAGSFYGFAFGLAAHKVLNAMSYDENQAKISMVANPDNGIGFQLSYAF